jgi:protein-S-isoprenylcysteine O-methyltransferase Ste14
MTIFIIIWSIWFLSEILLNRMCRSGTGKQKSMDRGTISIIWITVGFANTLGITAAIFTGLPIGISLLIPLIGLLIILAGMILRFIAILTLGKFFTVDVAIRKNHKIKQDGIYGLVRHPSYAGSILSFIGFGISLNNWLSLILVSIPVTIAMLYRMKIEERLLVEQFSSDYQDYMKRTYRLIPWIY